MPNHISYPTPGVAAWHDEETDVAQTIGPTDVHVVKSAVDEGHAPGNPNINHD
jgi:hypothetical protein